MCPMIAALRSMSVLGNAAPLVAWMWILRACAPAEPQVLSSLPPFDAAFVRLSPTEVAALPLAVHFVAPMGAENGALTYNARPFRTKSHLGDDLNGIGGWNSDLGDPVYASGEGKVVYTGVPSDGWGRMILLAHRVPDPAAPQGFRVYLTVYAHLQSVQAKYGDVVACGARIATVGTADGKYRAHLHFEVRESRSLYPGMGYADGPLDRVPPEQFLRQHAQPAIPSRQGF
jgi:murein DD-endopeptidase MepM/ murein hydrolase activator NlpD